MTIRIGGVPYGVGAPLLAGLEEDPAIELVRKPPAAMIDELRRGELAAGLLSSIEAIAHPGYVVIDGIGIAAEREVRSVRAFRRPGRPIRTVGVDTSSATSVVLLRILLERSLRSETAPDCQFSRISPTDQPDRLPHDLVLLIGDCGLLADPGEREVWDMAQLWREWTGLPFVFALWLLSPGADAELLGNRLHRAWQLGKRRGQTDGTFGAVHYDLTENDIRGLRRFWTEARALGLVEPGYEPTFHRPAAMREESR